MVGGEVNSGVGESVGVGDGVDDSAAGGRGESGKVGGTTEGITTRVWLTAAATVCAAAVWAAPGSAGTGGATAVGRLQARMADTNTPTNRKRRTMVGILPPG